MEKTLDQKYDDLSKVELQKRLKREPFDSEIINAEYDNDLVSEVLWQLIKDLEARIKLLESKKNML